MMHLFDEEFNALQFITDYNFLENTSYLIGIIFTMILISLGQQCVFQKPRMN